MGSDSTTDLRNRSGGEGAVKGRGGEGTFCSTSDVLQHLWGDMFNLSDWDFQLNLLAKSLRDQRWPEVNGFRARSALLWQGSRVREAVTLACV